MHAFLYCHVLFIYSVIFTISRNVDCRRETDTREGGREGISGEGREDRGRKYARDMNFQKFLTTKPLTRNHPLLLKNALKLTYSKVKNINFPGVYPRTPLQGRGRKNRKVNEMKGYGAPHFFIQVYAYDVKYLFTYLLT